MKAVPSGIPSETQSSLQCSASWPLKNSRFPTAAIEFGELFKQVAL